MDTLQKQARLADIGRREIERRIYARRNNARNRQIIKCVYSHIHASSSELHERLDNIFNQVSEPVTEVDIELELSK